MGRTKTRRLIWMPRVREIRIARAETGLSYRQIAKDIGIAPWTVQHALGGYQICSDGLVSKVSAYFNRDAKELFFQIDLENPDEFLKANAA